MSTIIPPGTNRTQGTHGVTGAGSRELASARGAIEGWFKQLDTIDTVGRGDNLLRNLDLKSGQLHLQYPGGAPLIHGKGEQAVGTFKQWYGPVVDNFASNHHTLKSLDVKPDGRGGYDFKLVVNWQADPKAAGEPNVDVDVAQQGKVVPGPDGRFVLQKLDATVLPAQPTAARVPSGSTFDTVPARPPPVVAPPGASGNLALGELAGPAEIFRDVQGGNVQALGSFLAAGGDPNTRDPASGMTLLLGAAVRGQADAVRVLLGNPPPADIHLRHPGSQALPQHFAAQSGNSEVMRLLRDAGADMNAAWPVNGHTPLAEVAFNLFLRPGGSAADRQGLLDTMRLLVQGGANLSATSVMGRGILAGSTNPPAAPFIGPNHPARAEVEAIVYPGGVPPLAELQASSQAYLGSLLSGLTPPLPTEPVALARQELANRLNASMQEFMNQAAVQPPTPESTAALAAARARVEELVESGGAAEVLNMRAGPLEQTALHVAARPNPGNPAQAAAALPMVSYLLEHGARVTTADGQPLVERSPMGVSAPFRPAVFGYAPILQAILSNEVARGASPAAMNALVNQPGPANGMTMVLDAIGGGHRAAVEVLLQFGARVTPDVANYQGQTALTLAQQRAGSPNATQNDRELLQLVQNAIARA